ncbi:MAG TPA: PQQ-dependent sugar dehydrogenase [Candidatus Limnocylindria bacterium]|nr:PQQ-dependent sugar dehydrogenase [Candidatus Limnocylindria bacterium]
MSRARSAQTTLRRVAVVLAAAFFLLAGTPGPAAAAVTLSPHASGFERPIYVTHAGDSRLFVVEQGGRVWVIHAGGRTLFLDIGSRLVCCGEQGLLGLAFHPGYASNRLFYVNYTRKSDGATVIGEMRRSAGNANVADPASTYFRRVMLIPQPQSNHNGGWIGFKPGSPQLYIATGDGGGAGDPGNRAQNLNSLLGKILRINPRDPDGNGPRTYKIPPSNPFTGRAGRDKIWAYGLRNPWRCSFDRGTGNLWCADVGQGDYEEINRSETGKGKNYGWRLLEGFRHFSYPGRTRGTPCTSNCRALPVAVYAHSAFGGGNCSVTGGYVSRRVGATHHGKYVFGDYCSGKVWLIDAGHTRGTPLAAPTDTGRRISSFGESFDGRIYLTDLSNGTVYYVEGT